MKDEEGKNFMDYLTPNIIIFGESATGKSSILEAIIGIDIFPAKIQVNH